MTTYRIETHTGDQVHPMAMNNPNNKSSFVTYLKLDDYVPNDRDATRDNAHRMLNEYASKYLPDFADPNSDRTKPYWTAANVGY